MSYTDKFELTAKTFFGLEEVLAHELKQLGASNIRLGNRVVSFEGDIEMMYKANFHLRTAISILRPIHSFKARNEDELYQKIFDFDWSSILDLKKTFALDTVAYSSVFKHSQYATLKAKDAIVDQFRKKIGKRPYVDTVNPDVLLNLHISETQCTVSLNSSGEPLFKRGYRLSTQEAPLNEVLAAGLIALSGWDASKNFLDPMCGSGTLVIEASLMANNVPPGIFRKKFGFESWLDFNSQIFDRITSDESDEPKAKNNACIVGYDISQKAITGAMANVKNAFLHNSVELYVCDFNEFEPDFESGVLITNPPYGERLKSDDIVGFYKKMGDTLKHKYHNFDAWIISSNLDAMKTIGLHAAQKIKLMNASLECTYNKYSIYEGTKKKKIFMPEE